MKRFISVLVVMLVMGCTVNKASEAKSDLIDLGVILSFKIDKTPWYENYNYVIYNLNSGNIIRLPIISPSDPSNGVAYLSVSNKRFCGILRVYGKNI